MSRKLRVWYPGAIYHVTSRGNRRSTIFYDHLDRLKYLDLLEETRRKFPFILHSYCLMTNHIHLQLETIHDPIGEIMKMLHFRYAIFFNKRHQLDGHVFQDRYGGRIILDNHYMLQASIYIHLNPVEAKIVQQPDLYRWSSCAAYITNSKNPHIETEKILSLFSTNQKEMYRHFLERGLSPNSSPQYTSGGQSPKH